MAFQDLMQLTNRLLTDAEALAALTARLRLAELGVDGDPAVRAQLDRIADTLGVSDQYDAIEDGERQVLLAVAHTYLRQAIDLVDDPARPGSWTYTDPVLLRAQGQASGLVATLIAGAGLGVGATRILDVGTGVAGLAIALCAAFPDATVVGIDPWEPALEIARESVTDAGLDSRITLRAQTIQELVDDDGFDLAWIPSFFIPDAVLDGALARIHAVMRPTGTLVVGIFDGPDDPLAAAIDDLRTIRSGGSVITPDDAITRLERAGFSGAHEVERTWMAPLRLVTATKS